MNAILYFAYNDRAYYLGINCFLHQNSLPFNLKPEFVDNINSDKQFSIIDQKKYPAIASGFKFQNSNIKIKRIISYGYNQNTLIVKVFDINQRIFYFIATNENHSDIDNSEIAFEELKFEDVNKYSKKISWTEIDFETIMNVRFVRNILFGSLSIQLTFMFFYFWVHKKPEEIK